MRAKGVTSSANCVLHPWLKEELTQILERLPEPEKMLKDEQTRVLWKSWQEGLSVRITLSGELPQLRMLLVLDNLAGHKTPEMVLWMFEHGVMPLYTPLGASWLGSPLGVGRVGAAHPDEASLRGASPYKLPADHRVVGSDRVWVESGAHAVRVGREAQVQTRASLQAPTCGGRKWRMYTSAYPTTRNRSRKMASCTTDDSLVLVGLGQAPTWRLLLLATFVLGARRLSGPPLCCLADWGWRTRQ